MSNTIAPSEVARRVFEDGASAPFVLDVRNEEDFEEWRVDGSTNLPIYDDLLAGDLSSLEANLDGLPADREIAVMCVAGVTSARAADFLRSRGFDARSVQDGMNGWGRVHRRYAIDGIDGVVQIVRPGTGCVSYLVHDAGEALLVDPSLYVDEYLTAAADLGVEIVGVTDTHAHADHVSGAREISSELDVPYYLHGDDTGDLEDATPIADGDDLAVGGTHLSVLHTPGHTPGSVSFRLGDALLSGDTLFLRSVGRPDLEDNAEAAVRDASEELFDSIRRLLDLPEETIVLPGHFSDEATRPLATEIGRLATEADNELVGYVEAGDREAFVETIVESLAEEPANYNEIKQINWGRKRAGEEAASLELGPNNCAAN